MLVLVVLGMSVAVRSKGGRVVQERTQGRAAEKPPVDVATRKLRPRVVVDRIKLPGVVAAWEEVWVSAQVGGVVVSLAVQEGDEVEAGAVLCRLDDRDYRATARGARAALDRAEATADLAEKQLSRVTGLHDEGASTGAEYDAALSARKQARAGVEQAKSALRRAELSLERTVLRSPIAGAVSNLPVAVGELVSSGRRVARIVDLRRVRVQVGIPERDVLAARSLEKADVTVDSLGMTFTGEKVYLGVEPEERARVYRMDLAADNPDRLIRPGMFAAAEIVRGVHEDAVVVPLFSVIPREKDKVVFVEEGGVARKRKVELGVFLGREVEVTRGLLPGERLIVVGQRQVEDGDPVKPGKPPEGLSDIMP